jgi:hypothetical protein
MFYKKVLRRNRYIRNLDGSIIDVDSQVSAISKVTDDPSIVTTEMGFLSYTEMSSLPKSGRKRFNDATTILLLVATSNRCSNNLDKVALMEEPGATLSFREKSPLSTVATGR